MSEAQETKSSLNDKQKNLLDRVKNKAHLIGHLVGFNKLNELHSEWINKFWKKRRTTYVLKAHRGSYKSTAVTLFIALIVVSLINIHHTMEIRELQEQINEIKFIKEYEDFVKEDYMKQNDG